MRVTFDRSANAAYFYFADEIAPGGVARTVPVSSPDLSGMVNLDLDGHGRLLGLEIIGATDLLPADLFPKLS